MDNLASISLTELSPILGILAGMLAGFYALLKYVLNNASKTTEADREERQALISTFERVAKATEKSAREAESRNGHLAEISIQNKDAILEAINNLTLNQKIMEQEVEHQTVKNSN